MPAANQFPTRRKTVRRIWKTPGSKFNGLFLVSSLSLLGWVFLVYRSAVATQQYPGPYNDPFRQFGIVAFVLVLLVAAYTMRRRFMRKLPGRVQDWLWLHIWFGIVSVLIAFMHNNFQGITHDFPFLASRFTEAAYGTSALYALLVLVFTGIVGRLLDLWLARVIATEADRNSVGITRSVKERLFDLSLTIERLSAGKSSLFKRLCEQQLVRGGGLASKRQSWWKQRNVSAILASIWPQPSEKVALSGLPPHEANDFKRAGAVIAEHVMLTRSLRRQQFALLIIQIWRSLHIPLACIATIIIGYHSLFELWKMLVLHQ